MPKDPERLSAEFVTDMVSLWGDELASVVLYGSAARNDYVPGRSDLNFLVIVRDPDPVRLLSMRSMVKRWRKERVALPIFMQSGKVAAALDSYPLEFLTMKGAYRLLTGEDPLKDLSFDREHVRLQCERELRGKLLHLRAGLVDCEGNRNRMTDLIRASLPAMTAIFHGLLFLSGRPQGVWGNDLLDAGHDAFGLDTVLFHELQRIRITKRPPSKEVLEDLLVRYLREVERLVDQVDAGSLWKAEDV
ncbi:nucleotidyltransferase domain-containing protein [Candidatus Eisenbacteria bacterium]|uniref:Nucleotidyltransferase domain-containing protein n=1 Tax=Eiseniibacteriota bacterium TaxID=2212470 RepID=A0ABV6YI45_UNCEI